MVNLRWQAQQRGSEGGTPAFPEASANALACIPAASHRHAAVRVSAAAERRIRQGFPWVFADSIQHLSHAAGPGDLAVVFDHGRRFLAIGLYDPHSPIRVLILQRGQGATIDREWFRLRVADAARLRKPLQRTKTTGYRLVHGENDGMPGLVVDRYDRTLVIKLYTAAWVPHLPSVISALREAFAAERLVLRLGRAAARQKRYLYGLSDGMPLVGPPLAGPLVFLENGLRFEVDPVHGQKTGFFLDQRENRARVEKLASGKIALNVFAYTGAFSVYAARGGARSILSVDSSAPALEAAERNFALNQGIAAVASARHNVLVLDAFEALARLAREGRSFDLAIVDPPSFAKERDELERALAAYARLTKLTLAVLRPGGILVMASCSSRVSAEVFFSSVNQAASQAGRVLRELERTGHALDHPVAFPEGEYLKCLFAVAE